MKKLSFILCLVLLLTSCTRSTSSLPEPSKPPAQTLVVYTSHTQEVYGPLIKEFQDRTGIWVQVETGGTNELMRRLTAESGAPVCDVMFGGSVEIHKANPKLFSPYTAKDAELILPVFTSEHSTWTPFSCLPLVIVYNTRLVHKSQIPLGWQSLFTTEWAGKIAFASPSVSASCYTAVATLIQLGNKEDWSDVNRLAANSAIPLLEGSAAIPQAVASGLLPLGITLEEAALRLVQAGEPVAIVYPEEGTSAVPDATSLIQGAPHPDAAKQFIDFTISRDAQQFLISELHRRPVRSDITTPEGLTPIENLRLIAYDIVWSSTYKEEIINYWNGLM